MEQQKKRFVLSLLAYAVQRDVSAEELCQLSEIELDVLKGKLESLISTQQLNVLWKNASKLTNDPLFGLHFGESLQLAALGVVGEIVRTSETVGQAISVAATLIPTVTDLFDMEVIKENKDVVIRLVPESTAAENFVLQQVADLLMVFAIHELDGLLLKKVIPSSVTYPYAVSDPGEYERVLRCRPVKSKVGYSVHLDIKLWDEPILAANYELQKVFLQKISSESNEERPVSYTLKVQHYLMKNAYLGLQSLADVAANFNMTQRSLQRKLQEESVTFQQLADSVRKSLALHYLASGNYQLKEISAILGYNELSAFSRAFKRWTGTAPVAYRDYLILGAVHP